MIEIKIFFTAFIIAFLCGIHMFGTRLSNPNYFRSDRYIVPPILFIVCLIIMAASTISIIWRVL